MCSTADHFQNPIENIIALLGQAYLETKRAAFPSLGDAQNHWESHEFEVCNELRNILGTYVYTIIYIYTFIFF